MPATSGDFSPKERFIFKSKIHLQFSQDWTRDYFLLHECLILNQSIYIITYNINTQVQSRTITMNFLVVVILFVQFLRNIQLFKTHGALKYDEFSDYK